jgi:Fe-S-cluster containining protein
MVRFNLKKKKHKKQTVQKTFRHVQQTCPTIQRKKKDTSHIEREKERKRKRERERGTEKREK